MQGRKIAAFSAMLACAALLLGGCGAEKAVEKTDKSVKPVIVVGSDNYPPYNYEDVDGRPTGIDVDLATEAFARMGYKAVFSVIDWEAKKELVESGEIDCIWGSFSIDGREDQYRWSAPYMVSRQVVADAQRQRYLYACRSGWAARGCSDHDKAGGYLSFA